MYWPKRVTYQFEGAEVRGMLAAIDYNHHCNRNVAESDGIKRVHRKHQNRSNRWSVAYTKENKDYSYLPTLIEMCLEVAASNAKPADRAANPSFNPKELEPTVCGVPPSTKQLFTNHVSRKVKRRPDAVAPRCTLQAHSAASQSTSSKLVHADTTRSSTFKTVQTTAVRRTAFKPNFIVTSQRASAKAANDALCNPKSL